MRQHREWRPMRCVAILFFVWLGFAGGLAVGADSSTNTDRCLMEAMRTAEARITIGALREQCGLDAQTGQPPVAPAGVIERRLAVDRGNVLEPYTLMAHRPNYILLASYNASGVNGDLFQERYDNPDLTPDNVEAKFQISIKIPLLTGLFDNRVNIFGAYTNRSFWQVYNAEASAPFRETNHEPEVWVQTLHDWKILGFKNRANAFGFVHQSNGRGEPLSRSWNRIFANFAFEKDNLAIGFKPWFRLPEDESEDDNPDITDYLGHYELRGAYTQAGHTFSLMLRNNLESGFSRGAVELSWSFPFWEYKYVRGYVQWFNGYGESLIDYNQHANSVGFGLLVTDWL